MTRSQAEAVAECWGGKVWQPIGGLWLVVVAREDGTLVVLSRGGVRQYADTDALEAGDPDSEIEFDVED